MRAINRSPSTNTKTKLDLTKAYSDFPKPVIAFAKLNKKIHSTMDFLVKFVFFPNIFYDL
jgi:hypothetical protein